MKDRQLLINNLENEIKALKNMIEHRRLYNIRNFILRTLLKSGIALDYALPYIIAIMIMSNSQVFNENKPFILDNISEKARVETIDTSNGIHQVNLSYDIQYEKETIEYSTGWIVNEAGLYERTSISYKISDKLNLSDTEKILSMSKEELEKLLAITDIRTIKKNILLPDDDIYMYDGIIVVNHSESLREFITRKETMGENIINTLLYILMTVCSGYTLENISRIFIKIPIRDRLKIYEPSFRTICEFEVEKINKRLKIKEDNLLLLKVPDSKN